MVVVVFVNIVVVVVVVGCLRFCRQIFISFSPRCLVISPLTVIVESVVSFRMHRSEIRHAGGVSGEVEVRFE